jgi:hypothetical protein
MAMDQLSSMFTRLKRGFVCDTDINHAGGKRQSPVKGKLENDIALDGAEPDDESFEFLEASETKSTPCIPNPYICSDLHQVMSLSSL